MAERDPARPKVRRRERDIHAAYVDRARTPEELQVEAWVEMWRWIGRHYFDDCREPCPGCGWQNGIIHAKGCWLCCKTKRCRYCYVEPGKPHEPDCDGPGGFE